MCWSLAKRATLKLVGKVTSRKLIFSPGGRIACGSGLHSVSAPGSKLSHTLASVKAGFSASVFKPGMRFRYGKGGMFMIDIVGFRLFATASSSSRTPGERYCGSCIASATRSKSDGLTSPGPAADSLPGKLRELSSMGSLRPRIGKRTRAPSLLKASTSAGRQTIVILWPPNSSFVARSEP